MGFHVKAMTTLYKRTDNTRNQSQRGAAAAATAYLEAVCIYWLRALSVRDGRLFGPIGVELEEELEMRSLPEFETQSRDPVCLKA